MNKHFWVKADQGYKCHRCGYERTFNPHIDYTGGNIPFPLTGYERMNSIEIELYGECK